MKFELRLRPVVVADLDAGRSWYEDRSPGLGAAFVVACHEAIQRIRRNPAGVAADSDGIRSLRIHRFPYMIHYRLEGKTIVVFAILFGGRDPSTWQQRI